MKIFGNARKLIKWGISILFAVIVLAFVFLYIYPNQANSASNYPLYFYFNSILFADLFFKIPMSLSVLFYFLFNTQKWRRAFLYSGLTISIATLIVFTYGTFFGKNELRVRNYELTFQNLPENFEGYRIVQFSDIHLGSLLKTSKLLEKVNKKVIEVKPDIILFTGDLLNNYAEETTLWIHDLSKITKNVPAFSILGNHDYGDYSRWTEDSEKQKNLEEILRSQEKMGFDVLRNENTLIKKGRDSIFIIGVENWGHAPFPQYANLEKALKNVPDSTFSILLTHDPAHWESKVKFMDEIGLTFSGHTHGLQWGIKPAGIEFSLSYLTRKNWSGLYEYEQSKLLVSAGLGTIGIPWRIDMPADINVITLKRIKIN
jgi:predicted MPP superfamily phosphohydrolase